MKRVTHPRPTGLSSFGKRPLLCLSLGALILVYTVADASAQRRRQERRARRNIPVEDDVKIGMATVQQIEADPKAYPILEESEYPEAYELLTRISERVLASPAIKHKDIFKYQELKIIQDDETLNAFCTAGGFIYVYTGLIKYLESEDHLAGVLGHEIAHAEERHVAEKLEKENRRRLLKLGVIIAQPGSGEVAAVFAGIKLVGLRYGREQEEEADARSVVYLSTGDDYACNGAAGFFEKLEQEGEGREPPQWLSSHPDGSNRIRHIDRKASEVGCSTQLRNPESYDRLKAALP